MRADIIIGAVILGLFMFLSRACFADRDRIQNQDEVINSQRKQIKCLEGENRRLRNDLKELRRREVRDDPV